MSILNEFLSEKMRYELRYAHLKKEAEALKEAGRSQEYYIRIGQLAEIEHLSMQIFGSIEPIYNSMISRQIEGIKNDVLLQLHEAKAVSSQRSAKVNLNNGYILEINEYETYDRDICGEWLFYYADLYFPDGNCAPKVKTSDDLSDILEHFALEFGFEFNLPVSGNNDHNMDNGKEGI